MPNIADRITQVKSEMTVAAQLAGRNPTAVRLVIVTKNKPLELIRSVVAGGGEIIGESYVEEAVGKIKSFAGPAPEWHMIGHIQSRKARAVAEHFSWVHSLDRLKLARRLDRFAGEFGKELQVLLECNVSGEDSKFGFSVWDESLWPTFFEEVAEIVILTHLKIRGLMTMPPWNPDPEFSRPYFQRLRKLQAKLGDQFPQIDWEELSMGMSNDYSVAIEEGATLVRVGTAIVGTRAN
jgi:PLP dependent protein